MNPGPGSWIGVLGGGQLGRMLALEARRMGFQVLKWTGGDVSGAAYTADLVFEEPFEDPAARDRFIERVEVATVEFENVPRPLLQAVGDALPLRPSAQAVATCQHREREKRFLAANGIPCARFAVIDGPGALAEGFAGLPGGAILKTAEFGYDGKGQCVIPAGTGASRLRDVWDGFDSPRAVLEEKVELRAELSVLVARGADGQVRTYDPAENRHRDGILDLSIVPARLPGAVLGQAREIAVGVAESLDYVGLLAVEFFLATDGRLLVNEMAPRPHNSGHHSFDACVTSQFEQQLRCVAGLPLGETRLLQPAVMWNLLGDLWAGPQSAPDWRPILGIPGARLHLYGKCEARPGRKMGHVNFLAETADEALERAMTCRQLYGWNEAPPAREVEERI
jgi:5-(carboxyamino)imidazole ribonucleotide synthase